ncbi:winged helix-turn-helix domain-containing protein [Actinomadura sp. ATCC 31491]|uniref:Winged helix-turn-helix domain-containing protein n=1 Tax=Actinomadura luzonensis TaxID=2805427 RepID=A0ABT0GB49_9ACTN|nr:BTAD domain-containing putative transcriptional regulator [Actinomadura luzonensis]MCK2221832.1 winged helix-turn-helix domain-containing protein [Actinomadura luzonensis]
MRFGVLGPLAVWTDAGEAVTVPGLKVRALLVDLLVHDGHPVSVDRLVDDLWGEEPPGNPAAALQVRVSQLRKALEDAEAGGKNLVVSRAPGYLLRPDAGAVDAVRFAELLARAEAAGSPRTRAGLLGEALALWRGPAYADFADEEYTRTAILRLEEQRLSALEQHAEARLELGEHALLVGELGDLVARHPLRERLRAVHMRALYRVGRQSEALAGYAELRERLADELGLDPGPELVALHQAILEQDPSLSVPAGRPRTNLPAAVSKLIGRDEALAEVCGLLEEERLVTLTGSGGVGKTRLALAAADRLLESAPDGVWLVELDQAVQTGLHRTAQAAQRGPDGTARGGPDGAARGGPDGAAHSGPHGAGKGGGGRERAGSRTPAEAVMAALDIREGADSADVAGQLAEALRERRALLVLDNCEHVVEEVAELAELLLRCCPHLRVLATSREPLAVDGETLWNVPPLEVPSSTDLAAMARSDAVRLFVARAAASARGFALEAGNAQAVAQICRRLDGIPLALELAATRVRALGVHGVVSRLDDRFRLLAAGQRGAPARQQTLTAVIDWSWDLLADEERRVLRRLAVHAEGCTLEAAEAVSERTVSESTGPGEPDCDVLDVLPRLVDRSLVVVAESPAGVRYRLLESVSAYCVARLSEAGELDQVRRAHLRHYLALAEESEPGLYGHEQRDRLTRLDAEAANMRAALDTAVARADAERAARLVNALAWYWFLRGRLAEGRRSLAAALAVPGEDSPARARAAAWHAGFAMMLGEEADWRPVLAAVADPGQRARAELFVALHVRDMPTGQELNARVLGSFRALGDRWGEAAALARQARDAFTLRDHEALERCAGQSARIFAELGDRWGLLRATEWLASAAQMAGDAERAGRLFGEGLRMAEDLGLWPEVATHLAWLGWLELESGAYDRAMELCERARRMAAEQGYKEGESMGEMGLAFAARRAGRLDLAEKHLLRLLEGVPRDPDVEPPLHLPDCLVELGHVAELRGDPAAALALHEEAIVTGRRVGDPRTVAFAVVGAASASGASAKAARLLGLVAATRERLGIPAGPSDQAEFDRIAARVREGIGAAAYEAAYAEGAARKLDEVTDLL